MQRTTLLIVNGVNVVLRFLRRILCCLYDIQVDTVWLLNISLPPITTVTLHKSFSSISFRTAIAGWTIQQGILGLENTSSGTRLVRNGHRMRSGSVSCASSVIYPGSLIACTEIYCLLVLYSSDAKFEEHCSNICGDILD